MKIELILDPITQSWPASTLKNDTSNGSIYGLQQDTGFVVVLNTKISHAKETKDGHDGAFASILSLYSLQKDNGYAVSLSTTRSKAKETNDGYEDASASVLSQKQVEEKWQQRNPCFFMPFRSTTARFDVRDVQSRSKHKSICTL